MVPQCLTCCVSDKQIWLGNSTVPFPGGSVVRNSPANAGDARDTGSVPGSARSSVFLPGEFHGQRNPCGHKKSDTTEHALLLEQGNPGPSFLLSLKPQRVSSIESPPTPPPPHTLPDLKPTLLPRKGGSYFRPRSSGNMLTIQYP